MARTEAERLAEIEKKLNALHQERARLMRTEREKERQKDTRRKIIAGGIVLKHAEINDDFGVELNRLLSRFVEDRNRHLFDLPPREKDSEPAEAFKSAAGTKGGSGGKSGGNAPRTPGPKSG